MASVFLPVNQTRSSIRSEARYFTETCIINRKDGTTEGWSRLCFGHTDIYEAISCQETFLRSLERPAMKEVRDEMIIKARLVKLTTTVLKEVLEAPQVVAEQ